MHKKAAVLVFILLTQACSVLAQTAAPAVEESDSPGMLQRMAEKARQAKTRIQNLGGVLLGFAGAYYEDHIQPVTDPYFEWASGIRSSMWERVQNTIDDYIPFKQDQSG